MATIHYEITRHDQGWAYKVGDVFSETFRTHDAALKAARDAAARQEVAGDSPRGIRWEDSDGNWHDEVVEGNERPQTVVDDNQG